MFNIRVYGILKDIKNRVLVSDEFIRGSYYTKFPGGGLEFGEGLIDGLKREFREETGIEIEVTSHLYTTDFFVESLYDLHADSQVIAVCVILTIVAGIFPSLVTMWL